MCGIYFYLTYNFPNNKLLLERGNKCSHRGPDNSKHIIIKKDNANILFLFHRLSINGLNEESNQPFQFEKYTNITVMCNGEIYNYKELAEKYNIELISDSDCEIIIHLYNILPIQEFINQLDGVFSFVIYDGNNDIVVIGHDPMGIRSLYYSQKDNYFSISSEMKCLDSFYENNVTFFPPGSYGIYNIKNKNLRITPYYKFNYNIIQEDTSKIIKNIKDKLEKAVQKRLLSDRPIGCLLSGGLDSSIIASIMSKRVKNLKTFSIGLNGAPDLYHAENVANHLKTDHTIVLVSEKGLLFLR